MEFAAAGSPNCALPTVAFQDVYVTWLSALLALTLKLRLVRSLVRNMRLKEALRLNWEGPVMELRPVLPQCPAAGGL